MPLSDFKCRACGGVAHKVDKAGRLQLPANCPYCGIENPYQRNSLTGIAVFVALVIGLLVLSAWFK
jgi:hypothetical protein